MPLPLIATLGSTIGPILAQRGLDLLSGVFRGAVDKGTEQVSELIREKTGIDVSDIAEQKLTDEQWGKLREFELQNQQMLLDYRKHSESMDLERERVAAADRENARAMQMRAMDNSDWVVRRFTYIYATGISVLTFAFIFMIVLMPIQDGDPRLRFIDTILGFLLGVGLSAVIQYFFGSSAGSKAKTESMDEMTRQMAAIVRHSDLNHR